MIMLTVALLTLALILLGILHFLSCIWITLERIADALNADAVPRFERRREQGDS